MVALKCVKSSDRPQQIIDCYCRRVADETMVGFSAPPVGAGFTGREKKPPRGGSSAGRSRNGKKI